MNFWTRLISRWSRKPRRHIRSLRFWPRRPFLELLEQRVVPSATRQVTWVGGSGDWSNPSNWSINDVPVATDAVSIAAAGILPKPPITQDQITMLQGGDSVVTNDDARTTFGLPLVPLDEQIHRAV